MVLRGKASKAMASVWKPRWHLFTPPFLPAIVGLWVGGCSNHIDEGPPAILSPLTHLAPTAEQDDPLADHRPVSVDCSDLSGWFLEDDSLEIDTGHCNYLALEEPAAVSAPRGALITMEISHFDLTAAEPGEVHIALLIEDDLLWETHIDVPGDARVIDVAAELPRAVQRGDLVRFHLHNHGQNTYALSELEVSSTIRARDDP